LQVLLLPYHGSVGKEEAMVHFSVGGSWSGIPKSLRNIFLNRFAASRRASRLRGPLQMQPFGAAGQAYVTNHLCYGGALGIFSTEA
jgi:hypothetical protein